MIRRRVLALLFALLSFSLSVSAACELSPQRRVVLLKLDDLAGVPDVGVSQRWQQVTDFLETNQIAASYGIIGESLAPTNEAYFSWLKARVAGGHIELWNHGYDIRFDPKAAGSMGDGANAGTSTRGKAPAGLPVGEFNGNPALAQAAAIGKTQQLALQRTGFALRGFGPHASAVDTNTYLQLDMRPEIEYVWFYRPVDQRSHRAVLIERHVELEVPIFHPNFEAFYKRIRHAGEGGDYVALQGHPNEWDEAGFAAFKRVVQWLRDSGATFCRPSDLTAAEQWSWRQSVFHEESR